MKPTVGQLLTEELRERGWTQAVFAEVLGRPAQFVNEVLNGKKELTRESAMQVAAAFGTSPEFWLRAQDEFHLWRLSGDPEARARLDEIQRRAARKTKDREDLLSAAYELAGEQGHVSIFELIQMKEAINSRRLDGETWTVDTDSPPPTSPET